MEEDPEEHTCTDHLHDLKHLLGRVVCCCCSHSPKNDVKQTIKAEMPPNVAMELRLAADPEEKMGKAWSMTSNDVMQIQFTETGKKYGETIISEHKCQKPIDLSQSKKPGRKKAKFIGRSCHEWGINFGATMIINGTTIYLPGFKTYDPAGESGDEHSSELVGMGCATSLMEMYSAMVHATVLGCDHSQLEEIADLFRSEILEKYHGRAHLFSWLVRQLHEAMTTGTIAVTPYPVHIQEAIRAHLITLRFGNQEETMAHARDYLASFRKGRPRLPPHFHVKYAEAMSQTQTQKAGNERQVTVGTPYMPAS